MATTKSGKVLKAATLTTDEPYIDSHCHLDMILERGGGAVADLPAVIAEGSMFGPGFRGAVNVCCAPEGLAGCDAIAALRLPMIYSVWGVHPHDAKNFTDSLARDIAERVDRGGIAWGEIGLDYHYMHSPKETQRTVFARQIALATATGKPFVVHSREADDDTFEIMDGAHIPDGYPIHLHCFTGQWVFASRMLQRFSGLRIGLTGCATFKNAQNLHEVAKSIDLGRLVLETDGPFMAPLPHRGDVAHPGHIPTVAAAIAKFRGATMKDVMRQCLHNTCDLYRVPCQ